MGGLANRGTTTGDVTGGGGRSVMPNRDYLNSLAARRRFQQQFQRMMASRSAQMPLAPPTYEGYGPLTPPGGGYSGGVVPRFQQGRALTPRAVKRAWGYSRPYDPRDLTRQLGSPYQVDKVNAAMQSGRIPHFGPESGGSWGPPPPGGWQEGGQLEDPLFPVESELADESPWYPDEDVGFEAAAPMQGGFDIFGRSGG